MYLPIMNDIFLITVDALRRDYFNETYFSESWGSGLKDFTHFKNCYSNGVATPLSFPSIHTGYPVESKGELKSNVPTIAELYDGYTFAITNNPHLRSDRGYDRGFDTFTRQPEALESFKNAYNRLRQIAGKSDVLAEIHRRFWEIFRDSNNDQPDLSPSISKTADSLLSKVADIAQTRSGFFWVHLM